MLDGLLVRPRGNRHTGRFVFVRFSIQGSLGSGVTHECAFHATLNVLLCGDMDRAVLAPLMRSERVVGVVGVVGASG